MRVRAIDSDNDWLFGKGQNDYMRNINAVKQNIKTRLQEFLGDCFFNVGAGVDWFNLLGGKDQATLNLSISSVILNTTDVTGINQLFVRNERRNVTVAYEAQTAYGTLAESFSLDPIV